MTSNTVLFSQTRGWFLNAQWETYIAIFQGLNQRGICYPNQKSRLTKAPEHSNIHRITFLSLLYPKSIINGDHMYFDSEKKKHLINKGLQSINEIFYYNENLLKQRFIFWNKMAIDFKSNSLLLSIILVLTFEAGLLQVKIVYTVHLR